jgi:uncharacterized protein YbjQ (UPF0145 family)
MIWSTEMGQSLVRELKEEAYEWGADAVIGLTFQTASENKEIEYSFFTTQHRGKYGHVHVYSVCYGTAIRYIDYNT